MLSRDRKFLVNVSCGSGTLRQMAEANRNGSRPRGEHVVAVAALIVRDASCGAVPGSEAAEIAADDAPRVLALRRAADNLAGAGLWETLSGRVEHGEEPLADGMETDGADDPAAEESAFETPDTAGNGTH